MCINKDINVLSVFHIHVSFLIQLQRGILFMYSAFEDLQNVAIIIQFPVGHFLPGHLPFYTPPPRLREN